MNFSIRFLQRLCSGISRRARLSLHASDFLRTNRCNLKTDSCLYKGTGGQLSASWAMVCLSTMGRTLPRFPYKQSVPSTLQFSTQLLVQPDYGQPEKAAYTAEFSHVFATARHSLLCSCPVRIIYRRCLQQ